MNNLYTEVIKHAQEAERTWGSSYGLFSKLINKNYFQTGVEIGVAFGGHSEAILTKTEVKKLYGVDPYMHMDDYNDPMNVSQEKFDEIYNFAVNRLKRFGKRYILIRKTSVNAALSIKEQVDFVYIDGDHSYKGIFSDLCTWFCKVREGGIIGGHDYGRQDLIGVKKAVDEFFRRFSWKIHEEGEGVWWVKKEKLNISFIIPAFNCEKTIKKTVHSIVNTNMEIGDEIVIVDDYSIDNTPDVLNYLSKRFKNISIYKHYLNKGGGAARNTAIEHARNQLIFCLDADNILEKKSIQEIKKYLINNGLDSASFKNILYFKDNVNKITHSWTLSPSIVTLQDYFSKYAVPGSSGNYLFTKESWQRAGGYLDYTFLLDTWSFGLRQIISGSKVGIMPFLHYYHRYGHASYWVRECKTKNVSLIALQIIIPYLNLIDNNDVEYIMSKKGRYIWFDNLEKRPIKIAKSPGNKKITSLLKILLLRFK